MSSVEVGFGPLDVYLATIYWIEGGPGSPWPVA